MKISLVANSCTVIEILFGIWVITFVETVFLLSLVDFLNVFTIFSLLFTLDFRQKIAGNKKNLEQLI